jgi:hypothetical protein
MKKTNISKVLILSFVLILTAVVLGFSIAKEKVVVHGYTRSTSIIPEHDFEDIVEYSGNSFYISYTDFRLNIANATATPASIKAALQFSMPEAQRIKIRFDTAQELYNFSVDVSPFASQYQHAGTLLELHYVLGKDIDYNDLGGTARFIPIGYNYQDTLGDLIHDEFSGIFDGRGFEISNLYLADNKENELYIVENDQEIITTPYYSMFSFNSGTIKNFGLVNPLFELRIGDSDLTKAAHIVGENTGIVEKVYVNYSGTNKGIYFVTDLGHQTRPQAAGLVFWNKGNGQLLNSYYASEVVILPQHMRNFRVESPAGSGIYKAAIQPGVFRADTTSTVSGLVYDSTRYLLSVVSGGQTVNVETPSAFHTAKTTTELKTNGMDARLVKFTVNNLDSSNNMFIAGNLPQANWNGSYSGLEMEKSVDGTSFALDVWLEDNTSYLYKYTRDQDNVPGKKWEPDPNRNLDATTTVVNDTITTWGW